MKLSRKVLCLDWDKRSLRLVAARLGKRRTVLEDAHSHRLPVGLDADDPQALGEFIRSMMSRHRLHHKSVVVDVPRERAVINQLALPPTPPAEVAAAVRFQAMKELPFPVDSAAIDYVVVEHDERGMATEVLLAAVTVETLDRVRQTCAAAGLTPARIGLRPYANLTSVRQTRGLAEQRVLFIDVGPGATEIDVMHGDALAFARSANVTVPLVRGEAGLHTDSGVIALAEVGELAATDEAVDAAVNELLVEATRTLNAYRATDPDIVVDEIIVAGGTGVEAKLAERLRQRLVLPVALFDPTTALSVDLAEAPKLRSFSAALGLAWGLGREGALALDFLNPKRSVSARETLQRRARVAVLGAAIVLIAVVGLLGKKYYALTAQRDELRASNRRLVAKAQQKVEVLNRVEEAREWATDAIWPDELLNLVERLSDVGGPPGEKLVVQEIAMDTQSSTPGMSLRNVYSMDAHVSEDLVRRVNSSKAPDGEDLYVADQKASADVRDGLKFKSKTDVQIQLLKLLDAKSSEKKRDELRKKRLKDLGR